MKILEKHKNSLIDGINYAEVSRIISVALNLYYSISGKKFDGGYLAFGDLNSGLFSCVSINKVEKRKQRLFSFLASSGFNELLKKVEREEGSTIKPFYEECQYAIQMGEIGACFSSEMSAEANTAVAIYYVSYCHAMSQNRNCNISSEKIREKIHEHIIGFQQATNKNSDFLLQLEERLK